METHLRLLSLDGGGVRGLSSLIILEHLMYSINPVSPPKPCEYFDLIGGTSTGGLIAIMLGRLEMDIESCKAAYLELSKDVFQEKKSKLNLIGRGYNAWKGGGKFDSNKLKEAIQKIVEQAGEDSNANLRKESFPKCRVFVCATRGDTGIHTVLFRSYQSTTVQEVAPTIWEAARATTAAAGFFDPIQIGRCKEEFRDGGTGCNNPIEKVVEEARSLWTEVDEQVVSIVSIGTGYPSVEAFGNNVLEMARTLVAMSTETELTAETFAKRISGRAAEQRTIYHRFNVLQGLEDVGLDEHSKIAKISAATKVYLEGSRTCMDLQTCVDALRFTTGDHTHPIPNEEREHRKQEHARKTMAMISSFLSITGSAGPEGHLQTISKPTKGTLQWLYRHPHISTVENFSFSGILHVLGKPGSGKSVIFKSILERLQGYPVSNNTTDLRLSGQHLFYFAFSANEQGRQQPASLLASLIAQLLRRRDRAPLVLLDETTRRIDSGLSESSPLWSFHDLVGIFLKLITSGYSDCLWTERLVFVLDALDECGSEDERALLLKCIESSIIQSREQLTKLAWIITSRSYADIDFFDINPLRINLDRDGSVEDDIRTYITAEVTRVINRRPPFSAFRKEICTHLEMRANRMFLLVKLLLDLIDRSIDSSPRGIQRTLDSLPSTLSEIYQKIWTSIDRDDEDAAKMLLSWILCTMRPLSISEFNAALATQKYFNIASSKDSESKAYSKIGKLPSRSDDIWMMQSQDNPFDHFKSVDFGGDLRRIFGPLIQFYSQSETQLGEAEEFVTICHQTVREHFLQVPNFLTIIDSVHLQLAEVCARCIDGVQNDDYDTISLTSSEEELEAMNRDEDLLAFEYNMERCNVDFRSYAIKYRKRHVLAGAQASDFDSIVRKVRLRRRKLWFEKYGLHYGKTAIGESPLLKAPPGTLVDEAGSQLDLETQEQAIFEGDEDLYSRGEVSEYVKFPYLLPRPGEQPMSVPLQFMPHDIGSNASDHINAWLLHELRGSPLSVNLLARSFEAQFGDIAPRQRQWEIGVLESWYKDGTKKSGSDFRLTSASSSTP